MLSNKEQPDRARQPYAHEYINGPLPFELPQADEPSPEPTPQPTRSPDPGLGRSVRSMLGIGVSLVLLVVLTMTSTLSSEPRKLLVAESFASDGGSQWGATDNKLRWMYPAGRGGVYLAGGKGVRTATRRGKADKAMLTTTVRDVTVQFDFAVDRMTGGSGVKVAAILRKAKAGAYHVRVRVGSEGRLWLSPVSYTHLRAHET